MAPEESSLRGELGGAVARHRAGDLDGAVAAYRQLLERNAQLFDAWRLLGAALFSLRRPEEALEPLGRALWLRPADTACRVLRGEALAALGRAGEAMADLQRALEIDPRLAPAWGALGVQQLGEGEAAQALASLDRAISLDPRSPVYWSNLGLALFALERVEEALECHEKALELAPQLAPTWANRGKALHALGRHEEALASIDRSLDLHPGSAAGWNSRAAPLRALGRLPEALAATARSLELDADASATWSQRGGLLAESGFAAEAQEALEKAVALEPANRMARFNLGILRLTLGDFPSGWQGYESRPRLARGGERLPEWDGSASLEGTRILVRCEQGLGDAIQFARFVPRLAERAKRVYLQVPGSLLALFAGLARTVSLVEAGAPDPEADLRCDLLSLPHLLGIGWDGLAVPQPFLAPDPDRMAKWTRAALRAGPQEARILRIGVAVSGNPEHENDPFRSIPLERLAHLAGPARQWHLLQTELRARDEAAAARMGLIDHRSELRDFADTAALAACMDAVVSVDTAVAHLAGSLGVPTCVLLPANQDWRWLLERDDSPWYPGMRLFRQKVLGDWGEAVDRLAAHLSSN